VSELTGLSIAAIGRGLRDRAFSATELTRAYLDAMARARSLNAYVVETPEKALAMASASDARIAAGEPRPPFGRPAGGGGAPARQTGPGEVGARENVRPLTMHNRRHSERQRHRLLGG